MHINKHVQICLDWWHIYTFTDNSNSSKLSFFESMYTGFENIGFFFQNSIKNPDELPLINVRVQLQKLAISLILIVRAFLFVCLFSFAYGIVHGMQIKIKPAKSIEGVFAL